MTDYKKWEQIEASIEEDEEEKALRRLRAQKDDMSEKEVRRLHECWEQPEWQRRARSERQRAASERAASGSERAGGERQRASGSDERAASERQW